MTFRMAAHGGVLGAHDMTTRGALSQVQNHGHALAIHYVHYNFGRKQVALKGTPAMAAGIADHVWSLEEIVGLLDAAESKVA